MFVNASFRAFNGKTNISGKAYRNGHLGISPLWLFKAFFWGVYHSSFLGGMSVVSMDNPPISTHFHISVCG